MRARRNFSHIKRPVGVRGIKYRSKAEANYAAYLEWLRSIGNIREWSYECTTFWFTPDAVEKGGVRRGVTSYKPDFAVWEHAGQGMIDWHEVKGYLDHRSRVALKRMAKYYPEEKVVLVDSKQMRALARKVGKICPGWIP